MRGLRLGLGFAAGAGGGGPPAPSYGPELNPDPGFDDPGPWLAEDVDGAAPPTVSGGTGNMTGADEGSLQFLTRPLGADYPAGDYNLVLNVSSFANPYSGSLKVQLIRFVFPSSTVEAETVALANGVGQSFTLTAPHAINRIRIIANYCSATIDNLSLKAIL